ncbi:MAG TPA: hypothetical protein PLI19_00525 [Erysipelotrichaceae bacterium]|nr:hypothetical protein [Erysipelotrichaceae bacterium]
MRKLIKLILVALFLIIGMSGCDKGNKLKKMNQKQLWEYLSQYPRYFSDWGVDLYAFVFENEDDLTYDISHRMDEEYNLYFTEVISFSNEDDYLYKIEYENPYPDEIEKTIFYIQLNPEDSTRLKLGVYNSGELVYYDLYADVALTKEELFGKLSKYNAWTEENNILDGYYFLRAHDKNQLSLGIMSSGFGLTGTISDVKFHGYMSYTVSVDYPGYEGDEITDPYEAYTADYEVYFNPYKEHLTITISGVEVNFVPDKGATLKEFYDFIAEYINWCEAHVTSGFFINVHDDNQFYLGHRIMDFWRDGKMSKLEYKGYNSYILTVDYPKEGNNDAYSIKYPLYFSLNSETLFLEIENISLEFVPDKGLTMKEFYAELSKYPLWRVEKEDHFIKVYDKDQIRIDHYHGGDTYKGTFKIEYLGNYRYIITIENPGYAGDQFTKPNDPYTLELSAIFTPYNETLILDIENSSKAFVPDKGYTLDEFFNYINKYDVWRTSDDRVFVRTSDNKRFQIGLWATGGVLTGVVSKLTYHGFEKYTLELYYPAGYNFYNEYYEAFTKTFEMYLSPIYNYFAIWYDGELCSFVPH